MEKKIEVDVNGQGEELGTELNITELRRLISGNMEFTLQINKDVEFTLRELTQKDLEDIDNEMEKRGVLITGSPNVYTNTLNVLKISKALVSATVKGKTFPAKKSEEIEDLLKGLGEGVISGLITQYENEVSKKFSQVKKKAQ